MVLAMDMMTEMKRAIPNPDSSKASPIKLSVSNRVMALITNRKKPNVKIVNGKVKMISNGRTNTFKMDKIKLPVMAAPKPDK